MHFRDFIKEYFTFSRRERRGIFLLLVLIMGCILWLWLAPYFLEKDEMDIQIIHKHAAAIKSNTPGASHEVSAETTEHNTVSLSPFNPNALSEKEWIATGLRPRLARTISNYINKGGKFRRKEDLKKIYGMKEEEYLRLEPYILIPIVPIAIGIGTDTTEKIAGKRNSLLLELNSADSVSLLKLNGIGPYYAGKIVHYRERLGGFNSKRQLLELYKFDEEKLNLIEKNLSLDTTLVRRIDINAAEYEELSKHPYIRSQLAGIIIRYRQQHGDFRELSGLKKIHLVSDSILKKMTPYLFIN